MFPRKKQVDDAQSSSLALPARVVTPAELSESTSARHHLAGLWMVAEEQLQRQQAHVIEIPANESREGGRLEKLHRLTIR